MHSVLFSFCAYDVYSVNLLLSWNLCGTVVLNASYDNLIDRVFGLRSVEHLPKVLMSEVCKPICRNMNNIR